MFTPQIALLDVNNTAGKSLKEALDKEYGEDRTLFINCDVGSEEQIRGTTQSVTLPTKNDDTFKMELKLCYFLLPSCLKENCRHFWRNRHPVQQCWDLG